MRPRRLVQSEKGGAVMTPSDRGLPTNVDAERFALGSIVLDDALYVQAAGGLDADCFSLESHRRIFKRMGDLYARGEHINRVTIYNELAKHSEAEAVGGLTYLVSLDEGLPRVSNIDSYIRIIKEKSVMRRIVFAGQHMVNRAMAGEEDSEQIISGFSETLLNLSSQDSGQLFTTRQIIEDYPGGISCLLDPSRHTTGLTTGLTKFDEMTGGLHAGDLIILAARPGHGKSAMAVNIAQHVAVNLKKTAAVFSLEMSKESLLTRMLCATARVDSFRLRCGYTNADERRRLNRAVNELADAPLRIDDTAGLGLMELHSKLRRLKQEQPDLALAIVDYLQLMTAAKAENRNQEVSAISRGLKLMAKGLKIPMLVLSQLSRAPETRAGDHRPQLSDLRESGSIEQDADVVGFIFREEMYKPNDETLRGMAELIIGKQRNGPVGTVKLVFNHGMTKFENRTDDLPPAEIDD